MAIRFNQPQSMYVDPRSVEIGNTLRERFVANFQAADTLQAELDQLQVADFEGDQKMKKMLEDSTRTKLDQLADRGDYENMSLSVAKTARDFQRDYTPLKNNYNRYQAYVADVTKKYEDGDIDAETYQKAVAASKHGYTGIQVDANGNVDPNSYFTGMSLVKDVDIPALLEERIKGIVAEEEGQMIQEVGQGPNGMYAVTQSGNIIAVTADRVQQIYQGVISQPDVQAALRQKATLRTYGMETQDINNAVNSDIEMYKGQLAKGQELLATGGLSAQEAVQLQQQMSQIEQEVNTLTNKTDAQKQAYVKQREVAGILKPIESAFLAKNVYSKRPASSNYQKVDYDAYWMAKTKSALIEGRQIRKEQREAAKAAKNEAMSAIAFNAPGNVMVTQEADPREIVSGLQAKLEQMNEYTLRAGSEDLSQDALETNRQQQVSTAVAYDLAQARLVAGALEAGVLTEEDLNENGQPSDFDWWRTLSDSELDDIEDVYKDDESDLYWKQPKNIVLQTSDGEQFKAFEDAFKKAWPTIPKDFPVMVKNPDGEYVEMGEDNAADFSELTIKDVSVARNPIAGQANTNILAVTFDDGTTAMIQQELINSPYLNEISSQPVYKLNTYAQAVLDVPTFDSSNPYTINTTFKNSETNMDEPVSIRIFPGDNLDDTRYQIVLSDGTVSPKSTSADLKFSLGNTDLSSIVL